jgi:Ca-activated chloride channel family protein
MSSLMRCQYCGLLQDEPAGVKECLRCGGELAFETGPSPDERGSYLDAQLELDQVKAPAGRNVDRYLLVTLRTPTALPPDQVAPTESGRPPLGFTAVLDISGSMQGEKLHQAKEALRQALHRLREGDTLSLITFESQVRCVLEPTRFGSQTRRVIESALQEIQATGMTALDGGLALGLEKSLTAQDTRLVKNGSTNLLLLLSDGQANVGVTDLEQIGRRGSAARQKGLTVSTLGVGTDYNEALLAEIAAQGGGRYYHVSNPAEIPAFLTGELGEMASLAARGTSLRLSLPAGAALVPLSSAYPARQEGDKVVVSIGDIPIDIELEVPLRLTLYAQQAGGRLSVDGKVEYRSPAGKLLATNLNRVTVRFVETAAFGPQIGVVEPIAERVFDQLKAAYVLNVSRAMALDPATGAQLSETGIASLEEYAARLGKERASQEVLGLRADMATFRAAPAAAKSMVSNAFAKVRSVRKKSD